MKNRTKSSVHPRTTNSSFPVPSTPCSVLCENAHIDVVCPVIHWGGEKITLFLLFNVYVLNIIFIDVIIFHLVKVSIRRTKIPVYIVNLVRILWFSVAKTNSLETTRSYRIDGQRPNLRNRQILSTPESWMPVVLTTLSFRSTLFFLSFFKIYAQQLSHISRAEAACSWKGWVNWAMGDLVPPVEIWISWKELPVHWPWVMNLLLG